MNSEYELEFVCDVEDWQGTHRKTKTIRLKATSDEEALKVAKEKTAEIEEELAWIDVYGTRRRIPLPTSMIRSVLKKIISDTKY